MTSRSAEKDNSWSEFIKDIKEQPQKIAVEKPLKKITVKRNLSIPHALTIGKANGMDKSTEKKFRQSKFEIEAALDLHGFRESEAFEKVNAFIKTSYALNRRCILIISGKGEVLKEALPRWLKSEELSPFILSSRHPEPTLGGTGALYILLRRKRP